jgi:hypothetical protein
MSKITLTPVSNPQNLTSLQNTINSNNTVIQTAMDNTLSRDGTLPNQMLTNFDMNSNQILNLPAPATPNSPARLVDVNSTVPITVPPVGTSGAVVGLLNTGWTQSGANNWTAANTFSGGVTFPGGITLPANSVNAGNIVDGSITGTDLAAGTVANSNLANMPAGTFKANITGGAAAPTDVTVGQLNSILGAYSNSVIVKTANYTVTTSDAGTFALGGGVQFTLTFPAAGGFPSSFVAIVQNVDSNRGKTIAVSGFSNFILWPGQTCIVSNWGGSWYINKPGRWLKAGVTFFVDVNNGVDTNDGLASGASAFRTIGAACQALYTQVDCQNGTPTLQVANGIYTESVNLQGQLTGTNVFFIIGASPSGVEWRPDPVGSPFCIQVSDNAEVELQNIKFNANGLTGRFAIALHQTAVVDLLSGCEFAAFPSGTHMFLDHGGGSLNLPASYTVSGGCSTHIQVGGATSVTMVGAGTVTISGTPAIGVWLAAAGSGANVSLAGGTTYSGALTAGTQKYTAILNASISLAGTTLPGSVAGSATSGGQVV